MEWAKVRSADGIAIYDITRKRLAATSEQELNVILFL